MARGDLNEFNNKFERDLILKYLKHKMNDDLNYDDSKVGTQKFVNTQLVDLCILNAFASCRFSECPLV